MRYFAEVIIKTSRSVRNMEALAHSSRRFQRNLLYLNERGLAALSKNFSNTQRQSAGVLSVFQRLISGVMGMAVAFVSAGIRIFKSIVNIGIIVAKTAGGVLRGFKQMGKGVMQIGGVITKTFNSVLKFVHKFAMNLGKSILTVLKVPAKAVGGIVSKITGIVSKITGAVGKAVGSVSKGFSGLGTAIGTVFKGIGNIIGGAFTIVKSVLGGVIGVAGQVVNIFKAVASAALSVVSAVGGLLLGAVESITGAFGALVGAVGKTVGAFTALGVVGGILTYAMIKVNTSSSQLEQTMERVGIKANLSSGQIQTLYEQAIQVSTKYIATAKDVGEVQEQLAQVGFKFNQIYKATGPIVKLANAGLLNMGTTAKKVAGIVRAYSRDGRTAAEVTEVIGALSIKTALSLQEALDTMSRSGSMGALYGQSLEQIAAAMGAVANAGIPAMRAATAVENAMRDLYSNKNRVVSALKEIGVTAYTEAGRYAR